MAPGKKKALRAIDETSLAGETAQRLEQQVAGATCGMPP
jgi:hypothetical protein